MQPYRLGPPLATENPPTPYPPLHNVLQSYTPYEQPPTGSDHNTAYTVPQAATYPGTAAWVNPTASGYGNVADTPYPANNSVAYANLRSTYHSMMGSRNELLSNLASAEAYTRLSMQWLAEMRKAVEQMDATLHSMEAQLGPANIHNGSGLIG